MVLSIIVIISTTLELFLNAKKPGNPKRDKLKKYFVIFSIIKNTRSIISKRDSNQCIHTLTFIFVQWIYIARYYLSPLTINLIGFKRFLDSFILQILSDKKYFWVWTSFPFQVLLLLRYLSRSCILRNSF